MYFEPTSERPLQHTWPAETGLCVDNSDRMLGVTTCTCLFCYIYFLIFLIHKYLTACFEHGPMTGAVSEIRMSEVCRLPKEIYNLVGMIIG